MVKSFKICIRVMPKHIKSAHVFSKHSCSVPPRTVREETSLKLQKKANYKTQERSLHECIYLHEYSIKGECSTSQREVITDLFICVFDMLCNYATASKLSGRCCPQAVCVCLVCVCERGFEFTALILI